VKIGKDNQDVVDCSDIVCIGVLPKLAEEVLAAINFRADQVCVCVRERGREGERERALE
jgi:pyrroline-5-carboxylate reductase